jgi:hypothetical protein
LIWLFFQFLFVLLQDGYVHASEERQSFAAKTRIKVYGEQNMGMTVHAIFSDSIVSLTALHPAMIGLKISDRQRDVSRGIVECNQFQNLVDSVAKPNFSGPI